jgi:hypothetical protein
MKASVRNDGALVFPPDGRRCATELVVGLNAGARERSSLAGTLAPLTVVARASDPC